MIVWFVFFFVVQVLLRLGRFDRYIFIDLFIFEERVEFFEMYLLKIKIDFFIFVFVLRLVQFIFGMLGEKDIEV